MNNSSHVSYWESLTVESHMWIYTAPVILLFSICGNILTMLVMTQKCMAGTSTCVYLTLMAAADMTVVVVGIVPEWLMQMNLVSVWELHPWVCKAEMYAYYTILDTAIWILVAFTCDRFIAVWFPFHKRQYCTPRRAALACGIVYAVANLNMHVFWTRGQEVDDSGFVLTNCGDVVPYGYFEKSVRPWVVLGAASIAPFVIILSCNVAIVYRITKSRALHEIKGFRQTVIMCLSISFAFLVLVTPNIVLLIGKKYWMTPDNMTYHVARAVASQCVYINHSINFMLYALTGSRFREELLVRCRYSTVLPPNDSQSTTRMLTCSAGQKISTPNSPSLVAASSSGRNRFLLRPGVAEVDPKCEVKFLNTIQPQYTR